MRKMKIGFTLAEILITLSIIGVVAALTIPTLIQRTGDEEMVSKLMKAYSTLSQATEAIITEQGSPKVWNTDVYNLYNTYKKHLRNSKECGSDSGCFSQGAYRCLHGGSNCTIDWDNTNLYTKLILSDGVQVLFAFWSNDCTSTLFGSENVCADISVDLNGQKQPNIMGRDLFKFVLKETGLYPAGCDYNTECISDGGEKGSGYGCACKVIQEGAMNY